MVSRCHVLMMDPDKKRWFLVYGHWRQDLLGLGSVCMTNLKLMM